MGTIRSGRSRIVLVGVVAAIALTAISCGGKKEAGTGGGGSVIGLSMHFLADDYAKSFQATVSATAKQLGMTVRSASADGDPQKQLSDIQSFVAQKVDALIVIPIDEAAVIPALRAASDAGIPVLAASPVPGAEKYITAVVGPSDFENGRAACAEMVEQMKKNGKGMDVAVSTASVKLYRIEQREKGCRAALSAAGAKVVALQKGLSPEEGLATAQNLLSAHTGLDGIFASFSNLVIGAGNALKQAGRKNVAVSGIDADKAVIQLINEGYVTDVAAQFPKKQADLITRAAADAIAGKKVDADQQDLLPTRTVNAKNASAMDKEIWG